MQAVRLKQVRLLPRPGVPIGYLDSGKPVYPMLGASPDDDSEIEVEQDDEDLDPDEEPEEPSDGKPEDKGFQKVPRSEWLKVQNALSRANASAKQRREALTERDRLIKQLQDEKADREAADERRQLEREQRSRGKKAAGDSAPAPAPGLPDSVMTKAQVRQAVAEATRETEERTAAKYQTRVANLAAREALVGAGVPKASVARAVRMLNLDEVEVDDDGEVTGGLEDQVEQLRTELPQLFQAAEPIRPVRKRTPVPKVTPAGRSDEEQRPLNTAERMAAQILGTRV